MEAGECREQGGMQVEGGMQGKQGKALEEVEAGESRGGRERHGKPVEAEIKKEE